MIPYDHLPRPVPVPITPAERRAGRAVFALLVALFLAVACLCACAGTKPRDEGSRVMAPQNVVSSPPNVDSSARNVASYPEKVPSSPEKGTKPGLLSGIGRLFSTEQGRANRQAVRLAGAGVPRRIGKGAVYAPNNAGKIINGGNKPSAPITNADSGATVSVTAIDKNKGAAATGPGATATNTNPATGLSWWWLLIPGAYVAWRVYRSTIPFA